MGTLEETKREISRLKSQQEVRESMEKRNRETIAAKRELFALKHPKIISAFGNLKSGMIAAGKNINRSQKSKGRKNNNPFGTFRF